MRKILLLCLLPIYLFAENASLKTLLNSLEPLSLSQHLLFYQLYPESEEGNKALQHVWHLLNQESDLTDPPDISFPTFDLPSIVSLMTRQPTAEGPNLDEEHLGLIESITSHLPHKKLLGHQVWNIEELITLTPEEIDIAHALLVHQFECEPNCKTLVRQYEAMLDLMALQIAIRLPHDPTPSEIIREINRLIFLDMRFRFPPHSIYSKDIDLYTFLPSVLDGREGVCLGVSIIYLSIAQRLNFNLEIITPPGHIYVRYHDENEKINIETTARGINLPDETYLSVNTRLLPTRNTKEVVGLAFFNQASTFWQRDDHQTAVRLYETAIRYIPDDPHLKMLLAFNYLFCGKKSAGKKLLKQIQYTIFDDSISAETIPADYLSNKTDIEGIKAIYQSVSSSRDSILEKQTSLKKILSKYPKFRAGIFQLAVTYLQLGRTEEALHLLERYDKIDPNDINVQYYLTTLYLHRMDYLGAWKHLKQSQHLAKERDHNPPNLIILERTLSNLCPL